MPKLKLTPPEGASPSRVSKIDRLIELLGASEGATMPVMIAATDWQAHSIRGAIAGALRRKGHAVASEKVDGARRWKVVPAASEGGDK